MLQRRQEGQGGILELRLASSSEAYAENEVSIYPAKIDATHSQLSREMPTYAILQQLPRQVTAHEHRLNACFIRQLPWQC